MPILHISQSKNVNIPEKGISAFWMLGEAGIKNKDISFGIVELQPEKMVDTHNHEIEDQLIYIIEGYGKCKLGDEEYEFVEPGSLIFCPKGIDHTLVNAGKNILKWCFCYIPPAKIAEHVK